MNISINQKLPFVEEVARTTPLGIRVLRLISKVQDLFHSYVVTPLTNMWYGPVVKGDSSVTSLRKPLNSNILTKFCDTLENSNVEVRTDFLHSGVREIPNLKAGKNSLLIPVVLKGIFENHIVLLALTKLQRENKVLFYDSKGWTLQDHKNSKTIGGILLMDIFQKVLNNNGTNNEGFAKIGRWGTKRGDFQQNTKRVQKDSHNCGLYVIKVMQNISQERAPFENPPSFSRANTEARRKLIDILSQEVPASAEADYVRASAEADGFEVI